MGFYDMLPEKNMPMNCDIDLKRQMKKFYANINIVTRKFA